MIIFQWSFAFGQETQAAFCYSNLSEQLDHKWNLHRELLVLTQKCWFQNFTAVIHVAAPSVLIWILCDDELCHFLSATRFRLIKHTRLNVVAFLNELPKTQHDIASLIVDVNTYTVSQTCGFLLAWFTIRFAVLIASVFFAGYIVDIYSQWSFQREWVPSKIIESYKCRFLSLIFKMHAMHVKNAENRTPSEQFFMTVERFGGSV